MAAQIVGAAAAVAVSGWLWRKSSATGAKLSAQQGRTELCRPPAIDQPTVTFRRGAS
jgi:hypothetical protein